MLTPNEARHVEHVKQYMLEMVDKQPVLTQDGSSHEYCTDGNLKGASCTL